MAKNIDRASLNISIICTSGLLKKFFTTFNGSKSLSFNRTKGLLAAIATSMLIYIINQSTAQPSLITSSTDLPENKNALYSLFTPAKT